MARATIRPFVTNVYWIELSLPFQWSIELEDVVVVKALVAKEMEAAAADESIHLLLEAIKLDDFIWSWKNRIEIDRRIDFESMFETI